MIFLLGILRKVFKVVDDTVPDNWFFKYYSDNQFGVQAVWGPELFG